MKYNEKEGEWRTTRVMGNPWYSRDGVIKATPTKFMENEAVPYTPHEIMTRSKAKKLKGKVQSYVHQLTEQGEEATREEEAASLTCYQPDVHQQPDVRAHSLGDKVLCVLTTHEWEHLKTLD